MFTMKCIRNLLIFICVIMMIFIPQYDVFGNQKEMKIHYIDVGQGDSVLIETPKGKRILMDAGRPKQGKHVLTYLKKRNIDSLDLVIATHPDIDHIGGLITVLNNIKVHKIIDSGKTYETDTYKKYLNMIKKKNINYNKVEREAEINIDSLLQIDVLNATKQKAVENNEASIAIKLQYNDFVLLFMGDVGIEQEKQMMKQYDIEADILKVGHHGSKTSTSESFIEAVQPQVAVLTYGKENSYGHPVRSVLHHLWRMDVNIFSTAVYGDITIRTDGSGYYLFTEKDPLDHLIEETASILYLKHRELFVSYFCNCTIT